MRIWLFIGALLGMCAIIFSTLTSHLPDTYFVNDGRNFARIADNLLAVHSLAILIIAILQKIWAKSVHLNIIGTLYTLGIILFCFGVFYISCTGKHLPLPIAPMGGSTLLVAWLYLAISAFLIKDKE